MGERSGASRWARWRACGRSLTWLTFSLGHEGFPARRIRARSERLSVAPWTPPRRPRRVSRRAAAAARKPPCTYLKAPLQKLGFCFARRWTGGRSGPRIHDACSPSVSKTLANSRPASLLRPRRATVITSISALDSKQLYTAARHELLGGTASASLRDPSRNSRTAAPLDRWLLRAR